MTQRLLPAITLTRINETKDRIRGEIETLRSRRASTREAWLNRAVEAFRPWFAEAEIEIPEKIKVTCGWPSQRGTAMAGRVIGECWSPRVSKKNYHEIFISPWLGGEKASVVLSTLLHEAIHAAVGTAAGHGPDFRKPAVALGLEGKMTATYAGERLTHRLLDLTAFTLKPYPHAKIDATTYDRPVDVPKKQGTRMVKCECAECGMIVRTTRKWLDTTGAPHCACNGVQMEIVR